MEYKPIAGILYTIPKPSDVLDKIFHIKKVAKTRTVVSMGVNSSTATCS